MGYRIRNHEYLQHGDALVKLCAPYPERDYLIRVKPDKGR